MGDETQSGSFPLHAALDRGSSFPTASLGLCLLVGAVLQAKGSGVDVSRCTAGADADRVPVGGLSSENRLTPLDPVGIF